MHAAFIRKYLIFYSGKKNEFFGSIYSAHTLDITRLDITRLDITRLDITRLK